jgi:acetyl esterase/lipase
LVVAATVSAAPALAAADAGTPKERRAVVLLLHAGGWILGSASLMDPLEPAVRAAGMKPVPVEYALGDLPQAFADAEAAARRFRGRSVYAYGESAGGTMAAWLASRWIVDGAFTNSAIVRLAAFVRTVERTTTPVSTPEIETTTGEIMAEASGGPRFVHRHDVHRLHGAPLRLFGNCDDPVVPCSQVRRYARRYESVTWRRAGHGHIAEGERTLRRGLRWLRRLGTR